MRYSKETHKRLDHLMNRVEDRLQQTINLKFRFCLLILGWPGRTFQPGDDFRGIRFAELFGVLIVGFFSALFGS